MPTACGCLAPRLAKSTLDDLFVYYPLRYPLGEWHPAGLAFEDAWFTAADGTRLHGWYCPHPNPRAVVLVGHGNAGNLSYDADTMRILQQQLRVTAMIFDYRGFGRSKGVPNEHGVLADARAARAWLAQRANVAEDDIVLMGRSLGGGVMVDLAASYPPRALVLVSTFTSLPDVAEHKLPHVPVRSVMHNRLDSLSKIGRYHGPLLQSHGELDTLVPIEQARRLFVAANEPKWFVTIPGAKHNWVPTLEYVAELDRFLGSLPEREGYRR
ncbi:MAG TPA: alpha/beta hydrolase [Pirellulales bacterium]|nr:alpha/beta hydrolase [Pirellulales bacterium]